MTRALVCRQCGAPIDLARPACVRFCPPCAAARLRSQKAAYSRRWRSERKAERAITEGARP
jgi:hypothetical protein